MWDLQTRDEVGARMSRCLRRETESKKWERLHQRAAAGGSPRKSGKAIKKPEMISRGLMQAKAGGDGSVSFRKVQHDRRGEGGEEGDRKANRGGIKLRGQIVSSGGSFRRNGVGVKCKVGG